MSRVDVARLEAAYDRYADMLYRLALSHLHHTADAMDAVQDVFLKYAQHHVLWHNDEHERAWLIRTTINRCHDLHRKRNIRAHQSLDDIVEHPAPDNEAPAVLDAVRALPEKYRDVVVLHYLEGFQINEVASMLSLSVSAVKMRLSRARDLLRTQL